MFCDVVEWDEYQIGIDFILYFPQQILHMKFRALNVPYKYFIYLFLYIINIVRYILKLNRNVFMYKQSLGGYLKHVWGGGQLVEKSFSKLVMY